MVATTAMVVVPLDFDLLKNFMLHVISPFSSLLCFYQYSVKTLVSVVEILIYYWSNAAETSSDDLSSIQV